MNDLRFTGDLGPWIGAAIGAVAAAGVWWWYRRDVRGQENWFARHILPLLRAATAFLLVMMLTGPVLHHARTISERGRVLVFVDGSASMGLIDPQLPPSRKLLIARQLGWLDERQFSAAEANVADDLAEARRAVSKAIATPASSAEKLRQAARAFAASLRSIHTRLNAMTIDPQPVSQVVEGISAAGQRPAVVIAQLKTDLVDAADKLSGESSTAASEKALSEYRDRISALATLAGSYESWLRQVFENYAARRVGSGDAAIAGAVAKVDQMNRRQRIERLLTSAQTGLLKPLMDRSDVQLFDLRGQVAEPFGSGPGIVPSALPKFNPPGTVTNLSTPLETEINRQYDSAGGAGQPATAVVLISDGQHNEGPPPLSTARLLGQRDIPIYTVCVGALKAPPDIAVISVDAPQSVFFDDRLRGHILIRENLPPGQACAIRIEHDGKIVWREELKTTGSGQRRIPFDLPVRELADAQLRGADADITISSLPLAMRVVLDPVAGEARQDNNSLPLYVQAVTRQRKILLIDSRARWETRFLRNVLERDKRWIVQSLLVGPAAEHNELARGTGGFPATQQLLNDFDLLILGDVPAGVLREEEMKWIAEFVASRGGGLFLLDGRDGNYDTFKNTPLAPLLPVQRVEDSSSTLVDSLSLTDSGLLSPALRLTENQAENPTQWRALPSPHWLARTVVLPGAETLVEAVVGGRRWPAYVFRRYGAGSVLYAAIDETWRWRFEVADRYHERFWKQVCEWIMEKPFAVSDRFVQLDVDKSAYQPNEKAAIRVRVRDDQGRPLPKANVTAIVERDGKPVETTVLQADEAGTGLFRGTTEPLAAGKYEVHLSVQGISEGQLKARAKFVVLAGEVGELATLTADENGMTAVAESSGGSFLREEQAGRLEHLLAPLSRTRIIDDETPLWRSYWWFTPIMMLLSIEWLLRKRAGML